MRLLGGGRYRLLERLGGGGTSVVHRAEVTGAGDRHREVAVKVLRPQFTHDPALRRRFLREAELARRLDHPAIVRVLDAGEDGGAPYLVMELVRGETLRALLDRAGPFRPATARAFFTAIARALDHAHRAGIIHRDVKPENLFVTRAGVKLADFGNARLVSLASVTGASLTWGTPEYVAPEIFLRGRADPRSDLYSLGVVLHEMLTGRLPWPRAQTLTRLAGNLGQAPRLAPAGAGPEVDRLLASLLAFSPADRPAAGEEAVARLAPDENDNAALASRGACPGCQAPLPDDVPHCFACGHAATRLQHRAGGRWQVVLERLEDDAAATDALLRVLDPLVRRAGKRLLFLTGGSLPYSDEERASGIELPAVLFRELDESTARQLEALLREKGVAARAAESGRVPLRQMLPKVPARSVLTLLFVGGYLPIGIGYRIGAPAAGIAVSVGLAVIAGLSAMLAREKSYRDARGLFELRGTVASVPAADRLIGQVSEAIARVRAPDLRALFADVGTEVFRLARRAAELEARWGPRTSEAALFRRTLAAAPVLVGRLQALAAQVDALDEALAGPSEGELMQSMGRLERAAAGAGGGATGASHAGAREDLTSALERRHAAEQQRAQLCAALCQALGRLRRVYRSVQAIETIDEQEARALETASAELDAFLSSAPARLESS